MKAFYDPKPNCVICMDMDNWKPKDFTCLDCKKILREEVEVLQFGVGIFADRATIKKSNGSLATVKLDTITIIEEKEK